MFTVQQKAAIVAMYWKNGRSVVRTIREWRRAHGGAGCRDIPSKSSILFWVKKFAELGSLNDKRKDRVHPRQVRNEENAIELCHINQELLESKKRSSVRKLSNISGIPATSVWRIMRKDVLVKPYCRLIQQKLTLLQIENRQKRCLEFLESDVAEPPLVYNVIFSDECWFSLEGYVCSRNYRFWCENAAEANKYRLHQLSLHPLRTMVWLGYCQSIGLIGPFFIQGKLNGNAYRHLLQTSVIPRILELCIEKDIDIATLTFQQDGATPHTANDTLRYLRGVGFKEIWGDRDNTWPSHSPDLSPMDFWLWGDLKDRIFSCNKFDTIAQLQDSIIANCASITDDNNLLTIVAHHFHVRVCCCLQVNGEHFEHLL